MHPHHIDKCRAAGCHFLLSFLVGFRPFFRLVCRSHVPAKSYVVKVHKADFLHGLSPACHRDIRTKLSFCGRGCHCINMFSGLQRFNNRYHEALCSDCSKRAAVDTFSAADTFVLIDHGKTVFIVSNCVNRTAELTRPLQMCNRIIRTCLCTLSALFTLGCINMGPVSS